MGTSIPEQNSLHAGSIARKLGKRTKIWIGGRRSGMRWDGERETGYTDTIESTVHFPCLRPKMGRSVLIGLPKALTV